jgi:hypothetical protein
MLLQSMGNQFWMPLVLLSLALIGVFVGMVKRIKSLFFASLVFLFVALVGMVWHAQQAIGQVWPWWAFGIACGVALISLLGYIEKNRQRASEYLQKLQSWDV